jgi:hypothetical protein
MPTTEHLTRHDREIAAIRTLLQQGMRLLVQVQQAQKRTEEAQQRTEQNLNLLIESLRRGGNGHARRKLDVQ